NPAGSSFQISLPGNESPAHIQIMNMEGQILKDFTTSESAVSVETFDLSSGLYFVHINAADYNVIRKLQVIK
ncbi:MAG TPA: T9SS type A sorting domain-containing protein, partial [Bacteroidia bacterium]|nr:T9SS type A sorting domain-containing protein [Bacteroidia bacterium]